MTTAPMTAARFIDILRAEGLVVVEHGNWKTHTRTASTRPWGPVEGVLVHHTVTSGTAASVALCRNGHSTLPGPLCHGVIDKAGVVHLVGYGRCNHAGGGDPLVLAAIKKGLYQDAPAKPTRGNSDGVDGNRHFYGFECINLGNGKDPWSAAQLEAIEKASAAICREHQWTSKRVIGHLEWSDDKIDPRGFTMKSMRARVAERLGVKPPATGGGKRTYVVKAGDTLSRIASSIGVPWPDIARENNIKSPYRITPGQKLVIPAVANKPVAKPTVSVKHAIAAARRDPGRPQGTATYRAEGLIIERALASRGLMNASWVDGSLGTKAVEAYARLQRQLGYSGADANGIPGPTSLKWLGDRHGFRVVD